MRVASQGLAAPGGRRCGGGRLARRWRERPGGRGWVRRSLLHSQPVRQAQAVADEAGNFPTSGDLSWVRLRDSGARTERRVLPPSPPPPPPPPPQLTLPALAAIVTLTETYRVHRYGNAHPFQGPSSAVSRAVVWDVM